MYLRKAPLSAPWMMRWSYVEVMVITCEIPVLPMSSGGMA
ncbi:MAG: hypothetical protein KatS3mg043_1923 [Rhodothermaceae bacterium]|nr:MAG: hypothetical protein KatS3mg043_1923 [Rhodothermaceae bacterium]